jgi:hypothetical protein
MATNCQAAVSAGDQAVDNGADVANVDGRPDAANDGFGGVV